MKEQVDGIILVLSCQKHLNTRLKECKLPKDNYNNWKVIYVIGDLFLDCDYKINDTFMIIKCEDSYIHLLKKLVLAMKYVYDKYEIKEGILRSGDDLFFNEYQLELFLSIKNKPDFYGKSPSEKNLLANEITPELLKRTKNDYFMVNYYLSHQEDFDNPQHNLKGVEIQKYVKRPEIPIGPAGVLVYLSNKCCNILIEHMENIKYNIFHFDDYTQSYPYTIEDCAVSYILYSNKISFIHNNYMYSEHQKYINVIAYHTNMYK
jgi:hypothetical protein